jgi:hypothetical protein
MKAIMNVLILEDNQERIKKFRSAFPFAVIVEDVDSAKKAFLNDRFNLVFLDHDLGGEIYVDSNKYNTGMTIVKWIVENKIVIDTIVIHTCNKTAGNEMFRKLEDANYYTIRIPYTNLKL